MSAPLFVMSGAAERLPNTPEAEDLVYDPVSQCLQLVAAEGTTAVVDHSGRILEMASTSIQTWCRDPHDSTYKLKDDTDSITD